MFTTGFAAGALRAAFATRSARSGVGATLRAAFSATTLRPCVRTALRTSLTATFWSTSEAALSAAGDSLTLRTGRTEFVLGDFSVPVFVEFLEGLGSLREFVGIDGAVLICIECFDDRAHRAKSLSAGESLSRATLSTWLPFSAGTSLAWWAFTPRLIATGLISARTVSLRAVAARWPWRRRVLCDGEVG